MSKKFKKTPAILAVAIVTLLSLCITAFASGTFTIVPTGFPGDVEAEITFSNLNNRTTRVSGSGLDTFITGTKTTYTVTFTPTSGASTYVAFCDTDSTNTKASITIPKWSSGMPSTLSSTITLDSDHAYAIKKYSNSSSVTTSGTIIVPNLEMVY